MRAKPEGRKPTVNYHTGRTYVYIHGTHGDILDGLPVPTVAEPRRLRYIVDIR